MENSNYKRLFIIMKRDFKLSISSSFVIILEKLAIRHVTDFVI